MAETYIQARSPISAWWERYGFGDRRDLSLREIPGRAMKVLRGDAFAAPLQILTSPVKAGARILQGRPLDGVGVRPTEVFDSPENVALTTLAVAGPIARMAGGAWQGVRGAAEFAKYARSAKGIRDARRMSRAIAHGASEVAPVATYAGKALHWTGSPVRWLAEHMFKVPAATSDGGRAAADIAYTIATEEAVRRSYKAYGTEGQDKTKRDAKATRAGAPAGAGDAMAAEQTNAAPVRAQQDARITLHSFERALRDFRETGDTNAVDAVVARAQADTNVWPIVRAEYASRAFEAANGVPLEAVQALADSATDPNLRRTQAKRLEDFNAEFDRVPVRDWPVLEGGD